MKHASKALTEVRELPYGLVFYESPHRIAAAVAEMTAVLGAERTLTIARELSKRFEQVHTLPLSEAQTWLLQDPNRQRGEFVLIVSGAPPLHDQDEAEHKRVLNLLLEELPVSRAAGLAARLTGAKKNTLYESGPEHEAGRSAMNELTIARPDDMHLHLRDGEAMAAVLPDTARRFARAIVMPNLKPPVITIDEAARYRDRILAALPAGMTFEPLMSLYLTDNTPVREIVRARQSGFVHAVKYYPAGATTHSDSGVTKLSKAYPVLAAMEEHGVPLLLHGEVTDTEVDVFDREAVFIDRHLTRLLKDFPRLKVVLEHITTKHAVEFVRAAPANVAATITVHHLLYNRNAMFLGGIRPHYYCLPVLKRETHRQALIQAATSGNPKFFLGTDSAPHARAAKESSCGCAGIYVAHAAIELYAEAFEAAGALDKLEAFASHYGADFYGLPRNRGKISLRKKSWIAPVTIGMGGGQLLVPVRAGEQVAWKLDKTTAGFAPAVPEA